VVPEFQAYVGPRPFEEKDKAIFFGRDREIQDLLSTVIAHRLVLVYAQSGAGKTSLINAGLIHLLKDEQFEVLPVARVKGTILENTKTDEISNIYVFNTLTSWVEDEYDVKRLAKMKLVDFLNEQKRMQDEDSMPLPRAVIFDQFEEIFSLHQDRWKDREGFFEQVSDALEADPLLRVVFVIREDFIAQLDPYEYPLPERMWTRFHMESLRREDALLAIKEPVKKVGRSFAEGVAEKLVDDLLKIRVETTPGEVTEAPGEFIEAVQLQVVCQNLWQELPPDEKQITFQHLKTYGNVEQELYRFYEKAIRAAAEKADIDEKGLRRLCGEVLITETGTRGMVYRAQNLTGGVPNAAIDVLESMHLIRAEWRAGARWYELTHDRFIEPILSSNKVFNEKLAEKKRKENERLEKKQLEKEWAEKERAEKERLEKEWEERRRIEKEKSKNRIIKGLATFSIVLIILAGTALTQKQIAEKNSKEAEKQRQIAEENSKEAGKQRQIAEENSKKYMKEKQLAEENSKEAEKQKQIAEEQRKEAEKQRQIAEGQGRKARKQKRLAEEQKKEARVSYLNLQSSNLQKDGKNLDKSVLLAIESFRINRTLDAEKLIRQGLLFIPHSVMVLNHNSGVRNVVFSPDGKYIATASWDNTARVWDAATGKQITVLNHNGGVRNVTFSPDGKYIATASFDNTSRVWDAATGKQIFVLKHDDKVKNVVFSPDGKYIATASNDNTARLWDTTTGEEIFVLEHNDWVNNVVFSPDGKYIATASGDKTARIWDAATGKQIFVLNHNGCVNDVVFSPDGKYIATASGDKTAHIWDAATGKQIFFLEPDSSLYKYYLNDISNDVEVYDVVFSPDGKYIATARGDYKVNLWNVSTGEQIFSLKHDGLVNDVVFSPDGKYIATASFDNTSRVWDAATGKQIFVLNHDGSVNNVVFSPDGKYVATASFDNTSRVWDATPEVMNHDGPVLDVVFSPSGKYIATASFDNKACIWNASTRKQVYDPLKHDGLVYKVVFSPDGKYIATASFDNTSRVWDAVTGKQIFVLKHDNWVRNVVFSPDGKYIATASNDNTACVWDAATGKQIFVLKHDNWVNNITFSPDGKCIATASWDKKAHLWSVDTGEEIFVLSHNGSVNDVVFSPDGKYIATASADNTARVWDAATGKQIFVLKTMNGVVR